MGQQPQRTRPFVADPKEWEVVGNDDYEVVNDTPQTQQAAPKWSDGLGLNDATDSRLLGFLRGAGAGAVDLVQGARSRVEQGIAAAENAKYQMLHGAAPPPEQTVTPMAAPDTFSGKIGQVLPDVALAAVPVDRAVTAVTDAIPSAARASKGFQEVMGAAKNIPVDLSKPGDVALRISQLAERGGSMPMAVRKFIAYATAPDKPEMTYEVARDFASNISRLSANEYQRMTPVVAKEVANLRVALNEANAMAAKAAGKGAEYKAAMAEYAKAMKVRDAVEEAWTQAKKAALPVGAAVGGAYWMTRKLKGLLMGGE